jgi:hypothetical protein
MTQVHHMIQVKPTAVTVAPMFTSTPSQYGQEIVFEPVNIHHERAQVKAIYQGKMYTQT